MGRANCRQGSIPHLRLLHARGRSARHALRPATERAMGHPRRNATRDARRRESVALTVVAFRAVESKKVAFFAVLLVLLVEKDKVAILEHAKPCVPRYRFEARVVTRKVEAKHTRTFGYRRRVSSRD